MNSVIDFYVPIIDNYGDIGFALNLALVMTSKDQNLQVRFFSDDESLFYKMIGKNYGKPKIKNVEIVLCHTERNEMESKYPLNYNKGDKKCLRDSSFYSEGQYQKNNTSFYNLKDLNNSIPSKSIFTFFDYRLPSEYLKKGENGKNIIQFGYFLLHKGVEKLHGTSYEIDGNKFTHFIPSLLENTGGIIINNIKEEKLQNKEDYISYLNSKYNLEIPLSLVDKKWISVFVYKDTLKEILEVISERKAENEVFFVFDGEKIFMSFGTIVKDLLSIDSNEKLRLMDSSFHSEGQNKNIYFMPFLELLDYNTFLSICDINIVRGENSLCTSLSYGKPTLWDIYKEKNNQHNEKIEDFSKFLLTLDINYIGYKNILGNFNLGNTKSSLVSFLDDSYKYAKLFKDLGVYIKDNCNLYII